MPASTSDYRPERQLPVVGTASIAGASGAAFLHCAPDTRGRWGRPKCRGLTTRNGVMISAIAIGSSVHCRRRDVGPRRYVSKMPTITPPITARTDWSSRRARGRANSLNQKRRPIIRPPVMGHRRDQDSGMEAERGPPPPQRDHPAVLMADHPGGGGRFMPPRRRRASPSPRGELKERDRAGSEPTGTPIRPALMWSM